MFLFKSFTSFFSVTSLAEKQGETFLRMVEWGAA